MDEHHFILTVTTLLAVVSLASSEPYHIVPSYSLDSCEKYTHGKCTSLAEFAKLSDKGKENNLTLTFSLGEYSLTQYISVSNLNNVLLVSDEAKPPLINFEGSSGFILSNISTVSVVNLNMSRCGQTVLRISTTETVIIKNSLIIGNDPKPQQQPNSAVYITDAVSVSIIKSHFRSNYIYFQDDDSEALSLTSVQGSVLNIDKSHNIAINESSFIDNSLIVTGSSGPFNGGAAIYVKDITHMAIVDCIIRNNTAFCYGCGIVREVRGGAISSLKICQFEIINSTFERNRAINPLELQKGLIRGSGGAIYIEGDLTTITGCQYVGNTAAYGGSICVQGRVITISNSNFSSNNASFGSVIWAEVSSMSSSNSFFTNNYAATHGTISVGLTAGKNGLYNSSSNHFTNNWAGSVIVVVNNDFISPNTFITNDTYTNNSASRSGVVYIESTNTQIKMTNFTNNQAHQGAAVTCYYGALAVADSVISGNQANDSSVIYLNSASFVGRNCILSNNHGSLFIVNSQVELHGNFTFANNNGITGGAITSIQSIIEFGSAAIVTIIGNNAIRGGGIYLSESQLMIFCPVKIAGNTAIHSGGGLYAYQSEIVLVDQGEPLFTLEKLIEVTLTNNSAILKQGGGAALIASILKVFPASVKFSKNKGVLGGALSLEQSSKVYLYNQNLIQIVNKMLTFSGNSAHNGGAVYVSDRTAAGILCEINGQNKNDPQILSQIECFLQSLSFLQTELGPYYTANTTIFVNNTASNKGNDVYGGLFDRCSRNPYVDYHLFLNYTGLDYIKAMATFNNTKGIDLSRIDLRESISSDAVQLCFCMDVNTYNCTVMEHQVSAKRGGAFRVKVVAVDQIQNQVESTVLATFSSNSSVGRFKEEQTKRDIPSACTELEYNVYSESPQLQIDLYADGPCGDKGISKRTLIVNFISCDCPIGFQPSVSTTECNCECDKELEGIIANCSVEYETVQLSTNAWIGYVNESINNTGFIIYSTCPYDYCLQKPINISLNVPNGADMQCAYNRTNLLCGECKAGYSLVLGTSRCKLCTNDYLSLLVPFSILGILLVAFILILNLTVATGAIHGLIFYANIVGATQSIFFSSQESAIIISWLNLDFGIETCFYNGMNSYAKVLLQLVFPLYMIFLTIVIIILCEHSQRFASLLGNKNPVATLSTLILLSYSKLLRTIIAALQYTYIDYPDGSSKIVWFYDANVPYFQPSHVPRFIIAFTVVVLGAVYTILLLFGQWLPRLSNRKFMKWIRHPKYNAFIDAYHAPFSPKHRYWVGLLLLVRIILNLVEALRTDISVSLLFVGCIGVVLVLLKTINTRTYKNWTLDALENSFLVNLTLLSLATYHVRESKGNQLALISTSISIAFLTFLAIVCFHVYKYILKGRKLWEKVTQGITRKMNPAILGRPDQAYQIALSESDDEYSLANYVTDPPPNYTENNSTMSVEEPWSFRDPPIIRSALTLDQLREPALDILDPVTPDHYREARRPPAPAPRPVTCTVIDRPSR